jgi:hypothetical protein
MSQKAVGLRRRKVGKARRKVQSRCYCIYQKLSKLFSPTLLRAILFASLISALTTARSMIFRSASVPPNDLFDLYFVLQTAPAAEPVRS